MRHRRACTRTTESLSDTPHERDDSSRVKNNKDDDDDEDGDDDDDDDDDDADEARASLSAVARVMHSSSVATNLRECSLTRA